MNLAVATSYRGIVQRVEEGSTQVFVLILTEGRYKGMEMELVLDPDTDHQPPKRKRLESRMQQLQVGDKLDLLGRVELGHISGGSSTPNQLIANNIVIDN